MSKATRPADLRAHAHESGPILRNGWCSGCGLYKAVHGEHRLDCTAAYEPQCPTGCLYYPNVNGGQHRPDCQQRANCTGGTA
ncbi:hypothetical protein ACQ856_18245 [Mycolicibacterium psychrotolerans]|uniref:hypothetical protein n=1 Tax=Mycolicibacterium psychrotolerans TaxID=216929 RepID=UPI003D672F0D